MSIGLMMLSLTKAQKMLVEKAKAGPVAPFHGEWSTFYRLHNAGVMRYADKNFKTVELTPEARNKIK